MNSAITKAFAKALGVCPDRCTTCGGPVPWAATTISYGLWGESYWTSAFCQDCGQPRDWLTGEPRGRRSSEVRGVTITLDIDDLPAVLDLACSRAGRYGDKDAEEALRSVLDGLGSGSSACWKAWPEGLREIAEKWLGEPPDWQLKSD